MSKHTWILLAVVVGIAVIGVVVVNSQSFGKLGTPAQTGGTLGNVASIFKSGASIFGDVEKAFPSWFDNAPDPTPENLGSFSSSAGFVDQSTL